MFLVLSWWVDNVRTDDSVYECTVKIYWSFSDSSDFFEYQDLSYWQDIPSFPTRLEFHPRISWSSVKRGHMGRVSESTPFTTMLCCLRRLKEREFFPTGAHTHVIASRVVSALSYCQVRRAAGISHTIHPDPHPVPASPICEAGAKIGTLDGEDACFTHTLGNNNDILSLMK